MFSKKTIKDKLAIHPEKTELDYAEFLNLKWHEDEKFWERLIEEAPEVCRLHFAGGEPLINNHLLRFLEKLSKAPQAGTVQISFATNLTIFPDQLMSILGRFSKCSFYVSLDGTELINNYIRFPSQWDRVIKNLQHIYDERSNYAIDLIMIHSVIQSFNVFDVAKLCRFIDVAFPALAKEHVLFPLESPAEFSLQQLPQDVKAEAASDMQAYLEDLKASAFGLETYPAREQSINSLISFMNADSPTPRAVEKFKYSARVYDSLRKMKIADIEPRLRPALK